MAGPDAAQRVAAIDKLSVAFWQVGEADLQLIRDRQKEEAFAYLVDSTIPARNELLVVLADNVKFQESALRRDVAVLRADSLAINMHSPRWWLV